MKIKDLHRWDITPEEARALQIELAGSVMGGVLPEVTTVLGLDVSYRRSTGRFRASAVLLSNPDMAQTLSLSHEGLTPFPYVPGLLSFREVPALLPLLRECPPPSLIMVDGQGIAHPRGLGLASHVGLLTGIPTIGCAKSRLIGEHEELADEPGADRPLMINGKLSGYILRSKSRCNPLYVSPGHLLDPDEALKGVRICLRGYRLPEPIRLADRLSKQRDTVVRSQESGVRSQESGVRSQESGVRKDFSISRSTRRDAESKFSTLDPFPNSRIKTELFLNVFTGRVKTGILVSPARPVKKGFSPFSIFSPSQDLI